MIFDNALQMITEDSIIKSNNMCISVNPSVDRNYGRSAYFKVCNSSSPKTATKEIRLHFYDIGYEVHSGKQFWKLKRSDKEKLMILLVSKPTNDKFSDCETTWEALIMCFNNYVQDKDKLPLDLPIPNYTMM